MPRKQTFEKEYKKLNSAQKEAVDSIDGPVMVVAGPGTGKTQILALRIGNILLKTDTKPDGILCLTFTNSGVSAMKERLREYIGATAHKVNIFTFHSFGMEIIREYYSLLDLETVPELMDERDAVILCDQILNDNEWNHIRSRSNVALYFRDLKSLISVLKRERMSPENFLREVENEINNLKEDENNISSRGESKGNLKKEVLKNIENLERTREVVKFYQLYEEAKKKNNIFDYDDVLESLVKIVENGDEAASEVREKYLYVLIDEHQDSSGVQNEFLQKVWGSIEKPNIFVVGDDRQLIYGFGGASLAYFEGFKHSFGKAKLITLTDNYRSTQIILDSAHTLLQSSIIADKLVSKIENSKNKSYPIRLIEADYPRDEIIACALDIKEKMKQGVGVNSCAILVPKNRQVRSTVTILRDMGLPVSSFDTLNFFDSEEAQSYLRILKIIANPADGVYLSQSFFDKLSGISSLLAHKFISGRDMKNFSILNTQDKKSSSLFTEDNAVENWLGKLRKWCESAQTLSLYSLVQQVGDEFLLDQVKDHQTLVARVEVIRTMLHLVLAQIEKNPKLTLKEFLAFVERLESYDEHIPLSIFSADEGVKVLTLHSSKGLEFDYVWIAHMDEKSLVSGKRQSFALPTSVKEKLEEKNEEVIKRQLYVAITRAKRFCNISYARHSYTGGDQELATIIAELSDDIFEKQTAVETEKFILKNDPRNYVKREKAEKESVNLSLLVNLVKNEYEKRKVSVTLLNNFFECPWKWYFRNLLQLPEGKSESLEFGNAVHSSIDKILKTHAKPPMKELEKTIDKEVFNIVSRWAKNRLPQIEPNYENEKSISVKDDRFPHLNIYGKLDLVENLDAGNIRVTDFKTGSVRKKGDIEKIDEEGRISGYLRQLAMYSYLMQESSKDKLNVKESRLEFLEAKDPKDAFYDRAISQKEIDLLVQDIKDYDDLIKKGEWIKRPCNYNSYGKNTECEYCKMAEIYKY